jgi:ABC-2 type transport system ATP-binding protein
MTSERQDNCIAKGIDITRVYHVDQVQVHALRGVNLEIHRGEFIALMGRSGSGKTTFIYYLLGFYKCVSQHPYLQGFDSFLKSSYTLQKPFSFIPEFSAFDLNLTILDYMMLVAKLKSTSLSKDQAKKLLQKVELFNDINMPLKKYSKGMKQRALLSLTLIGDSKTIILDEPTSGLDIFSKKLIEDILMEIKHKKELIISTHNLELAIKLEEKILILKEGKIVFSGFVPSVKELEALILEFRPNVLL